MSKVIFFLVITGICGSKEWKGVSTCVVVWLFNHGLLRTQTFLMYIRDWFIQTLNVSWYIYQLTTIKTIKLTSQKGCVSSCILPARGMVEVLFVVSTGSMVQVTCRVGWSGSWVKVGCGDSVVRSGTQSHLSTSMSQSTVLILGEKSGTNIEKNIGMT